MEERQRKINESALNAELQNLPRHESGMYIEVTNSGVILKKNGHELQQFKYDYILKDVMERVKGY
jgi:hypothetical protein